MGGNAVIGYQQHFDIEGDSGIVARGFGTACIIKETADLDEAREERVVAPYTYMSAVKSTPSNVVDKLQQIHTRRSSRAPYLRPGQYPNMSKIDFPFNIKRGEVILMPMSLIPDTQARVQLGGIVNARSVKYLGRLAGKCVRCIYVLLFF